MMRSSPVPSERPFELRILGTTELRSPEGHSLQAVLKQSKRFALLAYLAAAGPRGFHRRDTLLGLFWPEMDQKHARRALNQSLHFLRRQLGPDILLSRGEDEVGLAEGVLWCDAVEFDASLLENRLKEAVDLYRGSLLDGVYVSGAEEFEQWLTVTRDRYARRFAEALEALARSSEERGEFAEAVSWWRQSLEIDPYDSRLVVSLMRAMDAAGNRAAALEQARIHMDLMRTEFDAEPDPDVVEFSERLKSAPVEGRIEVTVPTRPELPERVGDWRETARLGRPAWRRRGVQVGVACGVVLLAYAAIATMPETEADVDVVAHRILAAPFFNRTGNPELDRLGTMASDWITQGLAQTGLVEVVPSVTTLRAAYDLEEETGGPGAQLPLVIAEETGAGVLVSGAYYRQGDSIAFQVEIVDAASGELIRSIDRVQGPIDAPMDTVERVRQRVMGSLATFLDDRLKVWAEKASQPPSFAAYQKYAEGLDLFFEERHVQSALVLRQAAAMDSTFTAPLIWAVFAHGNGNQYASADSVKRALIPLRDRMSPWDRAVFDFLLVAGRDDRKGAYRAAKRIAEIAPNSEWLYLAAKNAVMVNRPFEALEYLLRMDPARGWTSRWWSYWSVRLDARHAAGQHAEELEDVQLAKTYHPDEDWSIEEANALAALGRPAEALAAIEETTGGWRLKALDELAVELQVHNQPVAARRIIEMGLAHITALPAEQQEGMNALVRKSSFLYSAGRYEAARAALERMLALYPEEELWFRALLGTIAARQGRRDEALEIMQWLETIEFPGQPGSPSLWQADIAAQLGERELAMQHLHDAVEEGASLGGYFGGVDHNIHLEPLHGYPPYEALARPQDEALARGTRAERQDGR